MITRYDSLPCILLLALPTLAFGQAGRERMNVRTKGELQAVAAGALKVVDPDGAQWIVKVDPKSRYNVFQGSATVNFLRPGMFVSFRGSFDRKGKPQAEINQLKVFTPQEDSRLGVKPVSSGFGAGGLFTAEEEEEAKKKPAAQPEVLPLDVSGRIRSIKGNKMIVLAGATPLTVNLAEKVQIGFAIADFRLVKSGDSVEVSGWAYPNQPNLVMASRVTITAAEPLGVEKEEKPAKMPDLNSLDEF